MRSVQLTNGEKISYRVRRGGKEVVLLLHGNMTSSKHWDLVLESFDENYTLYAVDLRGFGKSTYMSPIESIRDFSDDVKDFVDTLELDSFSMIGWSMGGAVAQQFCADYPGYCQRLVLLASASTRGYPFYGTGADGLPDVNHRLTTYEEVKQDAGKTIAVQGAYDRQDKEFLRLLWNSLIYTQKQPPKQRYDAYLEDMLTQRNLAEVYQALNRFNISSTYNGLVEGTNQVKDIDIPILVLRGDQDLVVTEQMIKEILGDYGDQAVYKELSGAGHSPLVDNLAGLLQTIELFIADKERNYS